MSNWTPVTPLSDESQDQAYWPHGGPHRPLAERFWEKVSKGDGCCAWRGYIGSSGYGRIGTGQNRRTEDTHRVSWRLTYGSIPEGAWVLHRCDNRRCVRPEHLFLGDNTANVRDMFAKGRRRQDGEHNNSASLNWGTVVEILEWGAVGVSARRIGLAYGLDSKHVWSILHGQLWRA